jgi:hypothetical protein
MLVLLCGAGGDRQHPRALIAERAAYQEEVAELVEVSSVAPEVGVHLVFPD